MGQRPSNPMLTLLAVGGGRDVGEGREGQQVTTGVLEEFALHSGNIGGATRLAAIGASPSMIQQEGSWSSNAFKVHVRVNIDDSGWVSEVF